MNQFAVKKAERPPMPSNVLADLQKLRGSTEKIENPTYAQKIEKLEKPVFEER